MLLHRASEEALLLGVAPDVEHRDSSESGSVEAEKLSTDSPKFYFPTLRTYWRRLLRLRPRPGARRAAHFKHPKPRRRWPIRLLLWFLYFITLGLAILVMCMIVFPSYTYPPQHYTALRKDVARSTAPGRANSRNEKIFIAAALYEENGELVSGRWGRSVSALIDLLGPQNVFLSVYENDPDRASQEALHHFEKQLPCDSSIVHEHVDWDKFARVTDTNGTQHLKRIAMLAEVRNRALRPLDDNSSRAYQIRWDKLLYLNDVIFDPVDAANLLFSTNLDLANGKTQYRAACAADFNNPFKFYDTYATRDSDGYGMGVPIYPWFTLAGSGESRRAVQKQTDAVPVKSCWSGMIAFEGKWFQSYVYGGVDGESLPSNPSLDSHAPLRFRSEPDTYWDASECCLINGDLAYLSGNYDEPGIYMNPYIRTSYSPIAYTWQSYIRRAERLYTPVQWVLNWFLNMPTYNERRLQRPGEQVVDRVWRWDDGFSDAVQDGTLAQFGPGLHGSYEEVTRVATPGQFCGVRQQSIIKNADEYHGGKMWEFFMSPEY